MLEQAVNLVQYGQESAEVVLYLEVGCPGQSREERNNRRQQHPDERRGLHQAGDVGKPLTLRQMSSQTPTDQSPRNGLQESFSPSFGVCDSGVGCALWRIKRW